MRSKRWILWLLAIVVLVALVLLGSKKREFDWVASGHQLMHADWRKFAIGIGLIYGAYVLRALRWTIFLKPVKRVSPFAILGSQVIGFTGVALFGRLADLARPYLVARRVKLTVGSQIAVYTVERMFDAGAMALIFSLALRLAPDLKTLPHHEILARVAESSLVATAGMAIFAVMARMFGDGLANLAGSALGVLSQSVGEWAADKISAFSGGLNTLASFPDFLFAAGISLTMWAMIVLAYLETLWAFVGSPELSGMTLARCMVVMAFGMVGSVFQAPVIGWFTTIAASGTGLGLLGVPQEQAAAAGAMLLIVSFLSIVPVGLVWSRFERVSLKQVAEESEHAEESLVLGESPAEAEVSLPRR